MKLTRPTIVIALLLAVAALRGDAQDVSDADEQVVTERTAHPYSIDLLPDDPAPAESTSPYHRRSAGEMSSSTPAAANTTR